MIRLLVWLRAAEGASKPVGEIRVADPDPSRGGALRGEFRYDGDYLAAPDAFALDPVHLPLGPRAFSADRPGAGVHAVFNALLGNTDDHLKNLSMLHCREGWRLAPAYDLTPDEPPRGEHVLHFGAADHRPDAAALTRLARAFGLSATKGARIHAEVTAALSGWQAVFQDDAVSAPDRARLAPDIERRLRCCGAAS